METKAVQSLHSSTMVYCAKHGRTRPRGSLKMSYGFMHPKQLQVFVSARLQPAKPSTRVPMVVACSYNNVPVKCDELQLRCGFGDPKNLITEAAMASSILESEGFRSPLDEELMLKSKSQEIEPYLNGRCIYLVGMMGSGKTTVGKILSRVLSYSFFDSDTLVEEEVDGTSVADIFEHYGEAFFRDKETEVLQKLSMMHRHVISTGGGAVVRPVNWRYMHKGISVWSDVPIEALAKRITAVGTNSRPLLHYDEGDAYTRTLCRLSTLFDERGEAYANANARVSLENIATKLGLRDVKGLSPTVIAIEALEQIKGFLKGEDGCQA